MLELTRQTALTKEFQHANSRVFNVLKSKNTITNDMQMTEITLTLTLLKSF